MAQQNFCTSCGAERKPASLFCPSCGTKYPAAAEPVKEPATVPAAPSPEIRCKACGNPIRPGDVFCSKCLCKVPDNVKAAVAAAAAGTGKTAAPVQPGPSGAGPRTAPAAQPAAPSPGILCKACGNPIGPGDIFCSKCLCKVPDNVKAAVAAAAAGTGKTAAPVPPVTPGPRPGTASAAPAGTTAPLAKTPGKAIPSVECWQVEVTRRAGATKTVGATVELTSLTTDSAIQVTPVSPSRDIFEYPRISETNVDGSSWNASAPQSFTQTERMTVILDNIGRTMYCIFAPEVSYVPPVRGVTKFALAISDRMVMMPQSIPVKWARFSGGDFIGHYARLPVLLTRDYASFFTVIPLSADSPQKKTGLLAFAGDLKDNVRNMQLDKWEPPRNPGQKIQTVAQVRPELDALVSSPPGTTTIPHKQRICSVCRSVLIFDPDENALYCHGCGAYVTRFGMPPRQAEYLDVLKQCERAANRAPDSNLLMMRRAAFCPRCSSWLQYVFVPQSQHLGTAGNHVWHCPRCVSVCPEIMDRPLNLPHEVTCSHCGDKSEALQQPGVTACPSCGSGFLSAGWEAQKPMPEKDPNESAWERYDGNLMANYRLAGRSQSP